MKPQPWPVGTAWGCALLVAALAAGGCSRRDYRVAADRQVACIYQQKRAEEAFTLPPLPGIAVDPRSRFYDPGPPDCPRLPSPVPQLDPYVIPELATGDPLRPVSIDDEGSDESDPTSESPETVIQTSAEETATDADPFPEVVLAAPQRRSPASVCTNHSSPSLGRVNSASQTCVDTIAQPEDATSEFVRLLKQETERQDQVAVGEEPDSDVLEKPEALRIAAIPQEYWQQVPESCLPRMMEFRTIREEFRRSFPDATTAELRQLLSDAPRLTLANIMELTLINSREYQTQKEALYRVALRLTQERYQFLLRPTRRGNGTSLDYVNSRFLGVESSTLAIPTGLSVRQTTATAGQFLASFANNVVMTFNGPQGFAADVGSQLLFDFQQTLLQRDVVFESLTQAERDVVYAARDLIRFRRGLFVGLTGRYYNLLLTYRAIEISSQDYFSNLRAFLQGRADFLETGRIPRFQVDQFEQNALRSRSSLVEDCNSLESSLDRLKLSIGLPPEMPLNVRLDELESLTASDELTVTRQLVLRKRFALVESARTRGGGPLTVVNGATVLVDRVIDTLRVQSDIEGTNNKLALRKTASRLGRRLQLIDSRLRADQLEQIVPDELDGNQPPPPLKQFARRVELIEALLDLAADAVALRRAYGDTVGIVTPVDVARQSERLEELIERWGLAIVERQFTQLPELVDQADLLLKAAKEAADQAIGDTLPDSLDELGQLIEETVTETLGLVDQVVAGEVGRLDDVDVAEDQALLLALTQRLDLMNERGNVADARRQIKYAADDLRSIIDIRATHILRTRADVNRPFDFTFDNSETRLSLGLDTPLNRRIERNNYRASLINYNASRRALIDQRDDISFAIREDLRQLRLRRNQYEIAVASAALAYERVVSTRLQLQLSQGGVVARDFLEAQQAYTAALNSVARQHIAFILGRVDLFADMEVIRLDPNGYWQGIDEQDLQLPPIPNFFDANPNPFGRIPPCLHFSDEIRCVY